MKISIVINADTRPKRNSADQMLSGVVSEDFLTDGVFNKIKFFDGFDRETIVFIDEHLPVPEKTLEYLRSICDTVIIRKHTNEHGFNDLNYMTALFSARGDVIAHFDQDVAAFTPNQDYPNYLLELLNEWKYVSYPSPFSPNAVTDPAYNYRWASTRFFMCKRETIDFTECLRCLREYEYFTGKYNPSRVHPWTEHILGLTANSSVYYPRIELDRGTIFTWGSYEEWTLRRLNELSYDSVKDFVSKRGIGYPCDLNC